MKSHLGAFLLGLGAAAAGAFVYDKVRRGEINVDEIGERIKEVSQDVSREVVQLKDNVMGIASATLVDLNQASREDLAGLGIEDSSIVDRLIDGRPYRNKLDLLARMIIPQDVYEAIKDRIDIGRPNESVKVA